jgi:hypothetical protein
MIAARRLQRSFADGFIAEEVEDLWEPWMRHADEALNDNRLLEIVPEELSKRCQKSRTRGRPSTPVEVVLRSDLPVAGFDRRRLPGGAQLNPNGRLIRSVVPQPLTRRLRRLSEERRAPASQLPEDRLDLASPRRKAKERRVRFRSSGA